eukprot:COSAG01_NODE_25752_length_734_cov_1.781102_1_plen_105_part_00
MVDIRAGACHKCARVRAYVRVHVCLRCRACTRTQRKEAREAEFLRLQQEKMQRLAERLAVHRASQQQEVARKQQDGSEKARRRCEQELAAKQQRLVKAQETDAL